ncbi:DUF2931 family protein [Piscinibacter sakaiensis]|uniref:DUF2931 family protein n=1 Tax=Piscinibacter sakaiensis TaxID=1547922 RepID=UPI003726B442
MALHAWTVSSCAPAEAPAFLIDGQLLGPGGALPLPAHRLLHNGWGRRSATHLVGPTAKETPTALRLAWFSFAEDRFYAGQFPLPTAALDALLRRRRAGRRRGAVGGRTRLDPRGRDLAGPALDPGAGQPGDHARDPRRPHAGKRLDAPRGPARSRVDRDRAAAASPAPLAAQRARGRRGGHADRAAGPRRSPSRWPGRDATASAAARSWASTRPR